MTPVDPRVLRETAKYARKAYGNPSALHKEGVLARKTLAEMRTKVARFLKGHADEIIFTASGTEANNAAFFGVFKKAVMPKELGGYGIKPSDLHCLVSEIEHVSVLEAAAHLKELGVAVEYLSIDASGRVDVAELKKKLRPNTFLVSVMSANNEIGTMQPIDEIAKVLRKARKENQAGANGLSKIASFFPLFHCDASQSPLYLPISTPGFGADLITLDSHKVCGPRGVGALWMRRGVELMPWVYGGGQEKGLRSGTENLPGVAGFAKALELAEGLREREAKRLAEFRSYFIVRVQEVLAKNAPHISVTLNGDSEHQSPHIVSFSFGTSDRAASTLSEKNIVQTGLPIDHEFLLLKLDARGVACATKSACLRDEDESYVIRTLRRAQANAAAHSENTPTLATSSRPPHALRFSFGRQTTKRQLDRAIAALADALAVPAGF